MFSFKEYTDYELERFMDLIEEGLYLGSVESANSKKVLEKNNIKHVLAALDGFENYKRHDKINYFLIKLEDWPDQDILQHLPQALAFISEGLKTGSVLVHCMAGVSRSASIVIAYIMVKYSLDFDTAKERVRSKRTYVWPNQGFEIQLRSINIEEYKKYLN